MAQRSTTATGELHSAPEQSTKKHKGGNYQTPVFKMADKRKNTAAQKTDEFRLLMRLAGGLRKREEGKGLNQANRVPLETHTLV